MIIGSGLLAKAFVGRFASDPGVCIYAAGVSNSACNDPAEFTRERERLSLALREHASARTFVYFSTCSVDDPASVQSPYVLHKLAMEEVVAEREGSLIARLPQVAGRTPNPHTLLNYLYARISRSESFVAWSAATRNVIDVDDVAATVAYLIANRPQRRTRVNVASPHASSVPDIVDALARVVGKPAIVEWRDVGRSYAIDVEAVRPIYATLSLDFDDDYLLRTVRKYYGESADEVVAGRPGLP